MTISRGAAEITKNSNWQPAVRRVVKSTSAGIACLSRSRRPVSLQMLSTHAAKFRIVADQIGKLSSLLYEVASRQSGDALLESRYTE